MVLLNWHLMLLKEENAVLAWGILEGGHKKLADGTYIHTSSIEESKIDYEKGVLDVITYSRSNYELLFEKIDLSYIEETIEALKFLFKDEFREDFFEIVKKQKEKFDEDMKKKVLGELQNNELYLEMAGDSCVKALFKKDDKVEKIESFVHVGMFQDSVLIGKYDLVDFRYFPKGGSIEIYHWSDGLERVIIKNLSDSDLRVYGRHKKIIKGLSEDYVEKEGFDVEGLFSSDMVNGKSLLKNNVNTDKE